METITKGPWKIEQGNGEWGLVGAHANTVLLIGDDRRLIPIGPDARAISAVPELIEACQLFIKEFERPFNYHHAFNLNPVAEKIRAGLKKAGL